MEDNLTLVDRAWVDAFNNRDQDRFVSQHAEEVAMHDPTLREPVQGRTALGEWFHGLFEMFPDYKVEKTRLFGNGDWVCLEYIESGTMKGPIKGPSGNVPPTGKSFRSDCCVVCRVSGRKISEVRVYYDVLGLMGQLGLGPGP